MQLVFRTNHIYTIFLDGAFSVFGFAKVLRRVLGTLLSVRLPGAIRTDCGGGFAGWLLEPLIYRPGSTECDVVAGGGRIGRLEHLRQLDPGGGADGNGDIRYLERNNRGYFRFRIGG